MQGTPYIYQGEELGMTNLPFKSMDDFRDIQSIKAYREWVEEKKAFTHEEMMAALRKMSRDNARSPMQWDDSPNAGFSAGTPWIMVNPNYKTINAASQIKDPDSVFSFYKKIIALRKQYSVIVYGDFELLFPQDERVYGYRRRLGEEALLVFCNFSGKEVKDLDLTAQGAGKGELLISNYSEETINHQILKPYEGRAYFGPQVE
jgi:oligo-1,6-glucosidase